MGMKQNLDFFKSYYPDFRIVDIQEVSSCEIPHEWFKIFQNQNMESRKLEILQLWKKQVYSELFQIISYMENHLVKIELITHSQQYFILYGIKSLQDEIEYYEGGNPLDSIRNPRMNAIWGQLPNSITHFYKNMHNGFCFYASGAMGLVGVEQVTFFADDEWGIIEDLIEPLQLDLNTTIGFFKNGAGGYVAIDYVHSDEEEAILWFSNDQPEYHIKFWDIVDEWISIGFE